MFKLQVLVSIQRDDLTDVTVGCVVFQITHFHRLVFHQFFNFRKFFKNVNRQTSVVQHNF